MLLRRYAGDTPPCGMAGVTLHSHVRINYNTQKSVVSEELLTMLGGLSGDARSGSEAGSYSRPIDFCITQL